MILGRMMHEMSLDKVSSTTKPLWVSPEDLPEVRSKQHTTQAMEAEKLTKRLYNLLSR